MPIVVFSSAPVMFQKTEKAPFRGPNSVEIIVEKACVWYKARAVFAKSSNERAIVGEIAERWSF
jgi:hypothetical protein